jgi:hypothetical protein
MFPIPKKEDPMMESRKPEGPAALRRLDPSVLERLPPAVKKALQSVTEAEWPKMKVVIVACEPAGDLAELIPEMNRVMQICPTILSNREWRGEISRDQSDQAYGRLHDSVHGVRQAMYAILHLAGFRPQSRAARREAVPPPGKPASLSEKPSQDPALPSGGPRKGESR